MPPIPEVAASTKSIGNAAEKPLMSIEPEFKYNP